jgi:adenylate cyclase
MHNPPRILIADDNDINRDIIATQLATQRYELLHAVDGEQALAAATGQLPDLVLLDIMMPKLDGVEVCRRLKANPALPFMPIILVTAKSETEDVIAGLEAGADEYLIKPIDQLAVVARVKSVLRIKELHDRVCAQAAELASWNRTLEQRVAEQLSQIQRISRLKQFLPAQVAEILISSGDDRFLESHRREISVVFCDIRNFTGFAEVAEPEEVISFLREYHAAFGAVIDKFNGTVERFAGDGILVIFNDPLPCPDPSVRALQMAAQMRNEFAGLARKWRKYGRDLGLGIGIAHGYATLGCIGFEGRFQYSVTGTVANLASRLCDLAQDGEIIVDAKVHAAIEALAETESVGELVLRGFHQPVVAFTVRKLQPIALISGDVPIDSGVEGAAIGHQEPLGS